MAPKALKVLKVLKVLKAPKALKDPKDLKALWAYNGCKDGFFRQKSFKSDDNFHFFLFFFDFAVYLH